MGIVFGLIGMEVYLLGSALVLIFLEGEFNDVMKQTETFKF
jgi:hypothetical protein